MAGHGTSLRTYLLTRLGLVLPMVLILLTMVFVLMRIAPGDPISASLGGHAPQAVINQLRHELGFDQPLYTQYGNYLWDILRGDFGTALTDHRKLSEIISVNGAATLELTFFAMLIAVVVGVLVGLVAGRFRDTPLDVGGRLFGIVVKHLILPATTLGLATAGIFIRLIRVNVIRTLKDDYIEAARARGVGERSVVWRHAFRNALVPVITVVGLQLALLLSGSVLTETTFNWPGFGHELFLYLQN